nr:NERD domain-containing protein [Streptomyces atroolivaceus]
MCETPATLPAPIESRRSPGDASRAAVRPEARSSSAPWALVPAAPLGFRWEQEGLDHVRQLMPQAEPYRAWATFQFTGDSGRVNESDLLIAVLGGLYLLELKGHPGRVVNHGDTWQFHADRVRTLKNLLHLTDLKAKERKCRLERAARAMKP